MSLNFRFLASCPYILELEGVLSGTELKLSVIDC